MNKIVEINCNNSTCAVVCPKGYLTPRTLILGRSSCFERTRLVSSPIERTHSGKPLYFSSNVANVWVTLGNRPSASILQIVVHGQDGQLPTPN